MRILFVALSIPFPPTNGHRLRNWGLLRALVAEGHELTLIAFGEPQELADADPQLTRTCEGIECIPLPATGPSWTRGYLQRLRALSSPLPYGTWRFRSERMRAAIDAALKRRAFQLVVCDDIYIVRNLPDPVGVPVVLNKHDITSVILRRYLRATRNPAKYIYGLVEYWKLRRWEAEACSALGNVWTCSESDRVVLELLAPNARFALAPNVIDTTSYSPVEGDDGKTVLYVGSMDWYPNQDAVEFFASKILPDLRRLVPDVRFRVAGRSPSTTLRARLAMVPNVEFTGAVPDIRDEIGKATVCVVPLRVGSGTRLKILEASAMAKPVVSTRLGAEGLALIEGEEIVLADDPTLFARHVADLLADGRRRYALGAAARTQVEKHNSIPTLQAALRAALATAQL